MDEYSRDSHFLEACDFHRLEELLSKKPCQDGMTEEARVLTADGDRQFAPHTKCWRRIHPAALLSADEEMATGVSIGTPAVTGSVVSASFRHIMH